MKKISAQPLPKMMKGSVCQQWKKCGKPNCKCTRGFLHGPYYSLFSWSNGKQHKEYVPLSQVAEVQNACLASRKQKEAAQISKQHLRELLDSIREAEQQLLALIQG